MKKDNVIARQNELAKVNCYVAPTKNIDSGSNGKLFESKIKMYLNNRIATKNLVASKGKIDTIYKGYKIEIKSGCGTLDGIEKNDFVIYSPTSEIENALVFTPNTFLEIINICGLYRVKKSTNGQMVSAIQSFKNSQKKNALFIEMLKKYGMPLQELKEIEHK